MIVSSDHRIQVFCAYLCAGNAQEAYAHEHAADSHLSVSELDTVEVEDTQAVCTDQTVESQNLVHLDGRHKRASSLPDDVGDSHDVGELAGEWSSNRSITQLDGRWLVSVQFLFKHRHGELLRHLAGCVLCPLFLDLLRGLWWLLYHWLRWRRVFLIESSVLLLSFL